MNDSRLRHWLGTLARLSQPGVVVAMLFMAASLTPSLVPRSYVYQGIVAGLSLGIGYAIGVAGRWLWSFLELPMPGPDRERMMTRVAVGVASIIVVLLLWQASAWQNAVREIMRLPPVSESRPITVALIAGATFFVLLFVVRMFVQTKRVVSRWLDRFVPRRVSRVLAAILVVFLFWGTSAAFSSNGRWRRPTACRSRWTRRFRPTPSPQPIRCAPGARRR